MGLSPYLMAVIQIGLAGLTPGSGLALTGPNGTTLSVFTADSITIAGPSPGYLTLVGDQATPPATSYYGTDSGSALGYHTLPGAITGLATQAALTATGQVLLADIIGLSGIVTGISGADLSSYATQVALTQTGITLGALISGQSGYSASTYSTQVQLTQSGAILYGYTVGLSGALSAALGLTGSALLSALSGLSGYDASTYATQSALATTGSTLYRLITGISGVGGGAGGGVTSLNGISGVLTLTSSGFITVATSAGSIVLGLTGQASLVALSGASGALAASIATQSGYSASTYSTITSLGALSGDLTAASGVLALSTAATGSALYSDITTASGVLATNLTLTGQTLYQDLGTYVVWLTGMSGQFNTNISGTSGVLALSVATTGTTLYGDLTGLSGWAKVTFSTGGSAGAVGVSSLNGLTGALSITSSGYITVGTGVGAITLGITGLATTSSLASLSGALAPVAGTGVTLGGALGTTINIGQSVSPATGVSFDMVNVINASHAYSSTVTLDFNLHGMETVALGGSSVTFTGINYEPNSTKVIRIMASGTACTYSAWPSWVFLGTGAPSSIQANKTAILSLTSFATAATGVIAAYGVQL